MESALGIELGIENTMAIVMCAHMALFSFLISLTVSGAMINIGILDDHYDCHNHRPNLPTSGGVGIVAGLAVCLFVLPILYQGYFDRAMAAQFGAVVFATGLLGLYDDVTKIKARVKFVVLFVLSVAGVSVVGVPYVIPLGIEYLNIPYWVSFGGAVLWVFVVMNVVNFMDGVNGMLCGVMTMAFFGLGGICLWAGANTAAVLAWSIAAGLLAMAIYNWRRSALIINGDVGSLVCGLVFALLCLSLVQTGQVRATRLGPVGGQDLLYVGPLLLLPYLVDVLLTLLRQSARRVNVFYSHRSHLYQRLVASGWSHPKISALYASLAALMVGYVTVGLMTGIIRSGYYFALAVSIGATWYYYAYRGLPSSETED